MDLTKWVDKQIDEIKKTNEFNILFSNTKAWVSDYNNYLFNTEKGIDLVMSETMMITSIHLFSGNTLESKRFTGILTNNIQFEMSRTEVEMVLGKPNKIGGGYKDIFGNVPPWDKYYFDSYTLHFQYSISMKRIDIITIGSLKLEAYLNSAQQ